MLHTFRGHVHQHLARPSGGFHWLIGLRVTVVFCGPTMYWHITHCSPLPTAAFALGGLIVTVSSIGLTTYKHRFGYALSLSLIPVLAGAAIVWSGPYGWSWVALVVATAALVGASLRFPPWLLRHVSPFGLSVMVLSAIKPSTDVLGWVFVGGLSAMALTILTQLLTHERLRLPKLSPPAALPPPDRRRLLHNAVRRVAGTLIVAVAVHGLSGRGGEFGRHSYWMLYALWLVLQHASGATFGRGLQRVVGTLVGAVVTLAIVRVWPQDVWIGWVTTTLTFVSWGLWRVNYAWFVTLFAPVVLLQLTGPIYHPDEIRARVFWTITGSLLAVALQLTLWPQRREPTAEGDPESLSL